MRPDPWWSINVDRQIEAVGRIVNPLLRVAILLLFAILEALRAERIGYAWAVVPEALIATLPFAVICAGIDLLTIRPRQAWRFDFLGPLLGTANDFFAFVSMISIAVGTGSLLNILLRHGATISFAIYLIVAGASGLVWQYAIQRFIDKRLRHSQAK